MPRAMAASGILGRLMPTRWPPTAEVTRPPWHSMERTLAGIPAGRISSSWPFMNAAPGHGAADHGTDPGQLPHLIDPEPEGGPGENPGAGARFLP